LAVFRGGFTADAALQVAKVTPIMLASFVDRSLLRHSSQGRYEILESLRHFAMEKLQEKPDDHLNTCLLHSSYYAEMLMRNFPVLLSSDQLNAVEEIHENLDNIRRAWKWSVETDHWSLIEKAMFGLMIYMEISGNYTEAREFFNLALEKLRLRSEPDLERLLANVQIRAGWMAFCEGEHTIGLQYLQEGLESFTRFQADLESAITYYLLAKANERLNNAQLAIDQAENSLKIFKREPFVRQRMVRSLIAHTLEVYGSALIKTDQVEKAKRILQESLQIHQQLGQRFGSIMVLEALAKVMISEGDFHGSLDLRLESLKIAKEFGNKYNIATLLNNLSDTYILLKDYEKAIYFQQESIEISQDIGHRWLTAIGLNNLAYIFLRHFDDYPESIRLYNESLVLFSAIDDQRGIVYTLHDMGIAALERKKFNQARTYLIDALNKAHKINSPELQLYILSSLATIYKVDGQWSIAHGMCKVVLGHSLSPSAAIQRATSLMEQLQSESLSLQAGESPISDHTDSLEQLVLSTLSTEG
jgi:tetratricopeptide (TPR) repeat protein